jgi:hypothetical protein
MSRSNRGKSYEKIEKSFGQITVFRETNENQASIKANAQVKQIQSKLYDTVKAIDFKAEIKTSTNENPNENFYGINESEYIKVLEQKSSIRVESESKQTENSNYFDEIYFEKNKVDQPVTSTLNLTKDEIENESGLNYIDQSAFQMGKMASNIPLMSDNNELNQAKINVFKQIRSKERINAAVQDTPVAKPDGKKKPNTKQAVYEASDHQKIADEVPKWHKMTIDEGAGLLVKNICYFNINC